MNKVITFLAASLIVAPAYGQVNEFRYDGFADVFFSCIERGKGGVK